MKRCSVSLLVLVLLLTVIGSASASVGVRANAYYSDASVAFNSKGKSVFTATTTFQFKELKVVSCTLQTKSGSAWSDSMTLTPPSAIAQNSFMYDAEKDYSSSLASGRTYRLKATFDADGHQITKYSGEIKY